MDSPSMVRPSTTAAQSPMQLPLTPESSVSSMELCSDMDNAVKSLHAIADTEDALSTALHVMRTERDALTNLEDLYQTDDVARKSFSVTVDTICKTVTSGGRTIVTGVGKSGKIASKIVATMNSLGIRSAFLHPTEALHGDLGMIGPKDMILIITFSGQTPELISILPHLPPHLPRVVVTGQVNPSACPLLSTDMADISILLPAPIPTSEVQSFGVAAPTTSTTVALALTDALTLAVARRLHADPGAVFRLYHPGGTIGARTRAHTSSED